MLICSVLAWLLLKQNAVWGYKSSINEFDTFLDKQLHCWTLFWHECALKLKKPDSALSGSPEKDVTRFQNTWTDIDTIFCFFYHLGIFEAQGIKRRSKVLWHCPFSVHFKYRFEVTLSRLTHRCVNIFVRKQGRNRSRDAVRAKSGKYFCKTANKVAKLLIIWNLL